MIPKRLVLSLFKTIRRFFPSLNRWLNNLPDPRNQDMIVYEARFLVWTALLMFLFRLPSRRRLRFDLQGEVAVDNLNAIAQTQQEKVSHGDTVAYLLKRLPVWALEWLRTSMIRSLIRTKALEQFRLFSRYYLIAIDGTGFLSFRKPHCPRCVTMKLQGAQVLYQHPVVEAKLICHNGLAISVGTEFIENTEGSHKQDCELKAFYRLVPRLRKSFPRLPICLLLDGLYFNDKVFSLLQEHRLQHIVTFKEGSAPELFREYEALLSLAPEQALQRHRRTTLCRYRWMNDLPHRRHKLSVFECEQRTENGNVTRFVWATSFTVSHLNVLHLSHKGGRCRWKIENEGFNRQKNGGFGLGHPYSENWTAARNFYLLMQLADLLSQLIEKGNLLGELPTKLFGSLSAFALRFLEAWRTQAIQPAQLHKDVNRPFQIRLQHY